MKWFYNFQPCLNPGYRFVIRLKSGFRGIETSNPLGNRHQSLKLKLALDGMKSVTARTINERPYAYKHYEMIEKYLKEIVDIIDIVKPKYNLKGSD